MRVLATFLTWMAENKAPVFVVATSNDISRLPAELVRKGRFDEIFFVDLPSAAIRAEIAKIHLAARNQEISDTDLEKFVEATAGFSGAELEQAIVSALYSTHARGTGLKGNDLVSEAARTRPLSVVMAERVEAMRMWAKDRTVPAD